MFGRSKKSKDAHQETPNVLGMRSMRGPSTGGMLALLGLAFLIQYFEQRSEEMRGQRSSTALGRAPPPAEPRDGAMTRVR